MTTTVHTNISSTSVDGITVLMVESSDCSGISVVGTVADFMVPRLVDEEVSGNPEKLKQVYMSKPTEDCNYQWYKWCLTIYTCLWRCSW